MVEVAQTKQSTAEAELARVQAEGEVLAEVNRLLDSYGVNVTQVFLRQVDPDEKTRDSLNRLSAAKNETLIATQKVETAKQEALAAQAQAVGAVLCTSCVGIETVETLSPRLSSAQAAAVDQLTRSVDLLVFYAPWCRSCPYAEGLVDLIALRNPLVRYRLVNAEVERDLAAQHGVTRAGRTVVPAILRVDTGEVLFGAENLGDRLVALLQEAP